MTTPGTLLYLDHAATTPLRPEAAAAMNPFLDAEFGNPSGIHHVSRSAKAAVEAARERAAEMLGADHPLDIVFTGGGTESDNLGLAGPVLAGRGGAVTTAVEHDAVLETLAFLARLGKEVAVVGVDARGIVDPAAAAAACGPGTGLFSVMTANNETGARQPVAEVAQAVRDVAPRVLVHTDAVQSFVAEETTLDSTGADLMSLSAHKFGGPKGVGLLHAARDIRLEPVIHGGGQETGRRSGTHNVAGIVGMVAAMEAATADRPRFRAEVEAIRDSFEDSLAAAVPDVVFTLPRADRLVQHSHFRIPGIDAETLLIRLDGVGLGASAGSACHSGAIEVSHVLSAMGMEPTEAAECVRVTFGWPSRPDDGRDAAALVADCAGRMR